MKKLIQNEQGKFIVIECEDEELPVEEPISDWLHNYPLRLVVLLEMYFEPQYSIFLGYLVDIQKLPVERMEDEIHIYCNEIEEKFLPLVEADPRIRIEYKM